MATNKKQKAPTYISPAGVFLFPHLSKPDTGPKDKPHEPKFKCSLVVDPSDPKVQALQKMLDEMLDKYIEEQKAANPKIAKKIRRADCYHDHFERTKDDEGNVTEKESGNILFKFSMNAQYVDKTTKKVVQLRPELFDASNNKLDPSAVNIWGGTTGRIAFQIRPYLMETDKSCGLSLKLIGVRILNLVTGGTGGRSGESLFGDAEDGYEADTDKLSGGSLQGATEAGASDAGDEKEDDDF